MRRGTISRCLERDQFLRLYQQFQFHQLLLCVCFLCLIPAFAGKLTAGLIEPTAPGAMDPNEKEACDAAHAAGDAAKAHCGQAYLRASKIVLTAILAIVTAASICGCVSRGFLFGDMEQNFIERCANRLHIGFPGRNIFRMTAGRNLSEQSTKTGNVKSRIRQHVQHVRTLKKTDPIPRSVFLTGFRQVPSVPQVDFGKFKHRPQIDDSLSRTILDPSPNRSQPRRIKTVKPRLALTSLGPFRDTQCPRSIHAMTATGTKERLNKDCEENVQPKKPTAINWRSTTVQSTCGRRPETRKTPEKRHPIDSSFRTNRKPGSTRSERETRGMWLLYHGF